MAVEDDPRTSYVLVLDRAEKEAHQTRQSFVLHPLAELVLGCNEKEVRLAQQYFVFLNH